MLWVIVSKVNSLLNKSSDHFNLLWVTETPMLLLWQAKDKFIQKAGENPVQMYTSNYTVLINDHNNEGLQAISRIVEGVDELAGPSHCVSRTSFCHGEQNISCGRSYRLQLLFNLAKETGNATDLEECQGDLQNNPKSPLKTKGGGAKYNRGIGGKQVFFPSNVAFHIKLLVVLPTLI